MIKKSMSILVVIGLTFGLLVFNSIQAEGLFNFAQGQKELVVAGEQHGIAYQVFKGNSSDHYVIRFYTDNPNSVNAKITDIQVNLEIENGRLLSVAPAGQIEGNKSSYKFSSRRGLNSQLEDKGLFLIFKFEAEENSKGNLAFSITEHTRISKTNVTKDSELITFSLE